MGERLWVLEDNGTHFLKDSVLQELSNIWLSRALLFHLLLSSPGWFSDSLSNLAHENTVTKMPEIHSSRKVTLN